MTANLQNPIFTDETKAREWLEARVWPNGPVCPHCGVYSRRGDRASMGKAHRPGVYQCNECREQFTVTVRHRVRALQNSAVQVDGRVVHADRFKEGRFAPIKSIAR